MDHIIKAVTKIVDACTKKGVKVLSSHSIIDRTRLFNVIEDDRLRSRWVTKLFLVDNDSHHVLTHVEVQKMLTTIFTAQPLPPLKSGPKMKVNDKANDWMTGRGFVHVIQLDNSIEFIEGYEHQPRRTKRYENRSL